MCVLYVGFGSKVTPRIRGCVVMGSVVLSSFKGPYCSYILQGLE